MAVYEMLKADGSPFLDGACGLYNSKSDFDRFGEIVDDDEASRSPRFYGSLEGQA